MGSEVNESQIKWELDYHRSYVQAKQEIDKFLEKLISPFIKSKKLNILDAGCGIGHIIWYLSKISPASTFLGIDVKDYLIAEAKRLFTSPNIHFRTMDFYKLSQTFEKDFDVCISWKTLTWLSGYERAMQEMVKVTKKHIFISSLFYDGWIDFDIQVRVHDKDTDSLKVCVPYNIYSYPKFEKFCLSIGAKNIDPTNFNIEIDLPKPPGDEMGTYTVRTDKGERLQISGVLLMPWKIIRVDL